MEGEALSGPSPDPRKPAELGDETLDGRSVHDGMGGYGAQRAVNSFWASQDLVRDYAGRTLRPAEVLLLVAFREGLSGRVLEVGCGAGRLSGYLISLAHDYTGIDVSRPMLEAARQQYPEGRFQPGDLRDIAALPGPWDAIVAAYNILDVVEPDERDSWWDAARDALAPGGLLVFSSHNLGAAATIEPPWRLHWRGPIPTAADVVRLPRRARNRRRLVPLERHGEGWAILNDQAHDFSPLHFYTTRDAQAAVLTAHGLELLDCRDLGGAPVGPGDAAAASPELHYVALRP